MRRTAPHESGRERLACDGPSSLVLERRAAPRRHASVERLPATVLRVEAVAESVSGRARGRRLLAWREVSTGGRGSRRFFGGECATVTAAVLDAAHEEDAQLDKVDDEEDEEEDDGDRLDDHEDRADGDAAQQRGRSASLARCGEMGTKKRSRTGQSR